jgi:N-acetylglucosaminyl-diphospho-decaprenol L-rhamnosyltransferase
MMTFERSVTLSVVSHRQGHLVHSLLNDIQKYCAGIVDVILTLNLTEDLPFKPEDFAFPISIIENYRPKGFGANHNAAFLLSKGDFFCVVNPDVRLNSNPFSVLLGSCFQTSVGVVAPAVINTRGMIEKNARKFPTPASIFAKMFLGDRELCCPAENGYSYPDWVAGMFMLFRSDVYRKVGGFDEKFFLYYEDVDLCARVWQEGYKVVFCPEVSIVHDARRESHKNVRYLKWHLSSMVRFFSSTSYRKARR